MQVTTFRLEDSKSGKDNFPPFQSCDYCFELPQLQAYAVHHFQVELDQTNPDFGHTPVKYEIKDNSVILDSSCRPIFGSPSGWLTVYHNGIKDYSLLFPHITNDGLQRRLGQFAEEADNAFASQSWLSYVLMVGGVLEGLLYNEYKLRNFEKMISAAREKKLINEGEAAQINQVRLARNQIHANRYDESIPGRSLALDISVIYERLLKHD